MKKNSLPILMMASILFLFSCGNSNRKPSTKWADEYCERLMLRMDLCKSSYLTFTNLIPEESTPYAGAGTGPAYDVMIKTFDEQKQLLDKTEVWDGTEEDEKLSQKMKDLTSVIIDIYIEGGKKELLKVKQLAGKGHSMQSEELFNELISFENRLNDAYEAFGTEQEVYAKKYNIILY